jgi:hypothetical protein
LIIPPDAATYSDISAIADDPKDPPTFPSASKSNLNVLFDKPAREYGARRTAYAPAPDAGKRMSVWNLYADSYTLRAGTLESATAYFNGHDAFGKHANLAEYAASLLFRYLNIYRMTPCVPHPRDNDRNLDCPPPYLRSILANCSMDDIGRFSDEAYVHTNPTYMSIDIGEPVLAVYTGSKPNEYQPSHAIFGFSLFDDEHTRTEDAKYKRPHCAFDVYVDSDTSHAFIYNNYVHQLQFEQTRKLQVTPAMYFEGVAATQRAAARLTWPSTTFATLVDAANLPTRDMLLALFLVYYASSISAKLPASKISTIHPDLADTVAALCPGQYDHILSNLSIRLIGTQANGQYDILWNSADNEHDQPCTLAMYTTMFVGVFGEKGIMYKDVPVYVDGHRYKVFTNADIRYLIGIDAEGGKSLHQLGSDMLFCRDDNVPTGDDVDFTETADPTLGITPTQGSGQYMIAQGQSTQRMIESVIREAALVVAAVFTQRGRSSNLIEPMARIRQDGDPFSPIDFDVFAGLNAMIVHRALAIIQLQSSTPPPPPPSDVPAGTATTTTTTTTTHATPATPATPATHATHATHTTNVQSGGSSSSSSSSSGSRSTPMIIDGRVQHKHNGHGSYTRLYADVRKLVYGRHAKK